MTAPAYLKRIAYAGSGSIGPCAEALRSLHRAHMLAVPFENLDISLGRSILCEESRFLTKIVEERRGGFCYELNGAFAALLRELGFPVTLLSARVTRKDGTEGPDFDHMALRVELDRPMLADVGFGDSFLEPLLLEPGLEQVQSEHRYRLVEENDRLNYERLVKDAWVRQYSFTLRPCALAEFSTMCRYHQTSPDSHFTRQRVCSRATLEGRLTLTDDRLIETRNGRREERFIAEIQREEILRERFGIVLPR